MKSVYRLSRVPRHSITSSLNAASHSLSTSPLALSTLSSGSLSKALSQGSPSSSSLEYCSSGSVASFKPRTTLTTTRGFKTDAKMNQAMSGPSTSYTPIHDDPLFSTHFSESSRETIRSGSKNSSHESTSYSSSPSLPSRPSINKTSWSSPHDIIPRHHFLKDYSHLWTLLEACLETNNFSRAENVLISFSEHSDPKDITLAVNHYLLRLAELNENDHTVATQWLSHISQRLPNLKTDTITYAIIFRNKCLSSNYNKEKISKYIGQYSTDILKHVDVLGIELISKVVQVCFFFLYQFSIYVHFLTVTNNLFFFLSLSLDL